MLALLSSMPFESDQLFSHMRYVRSREIAGKVFCYGRLGRSEAVLVHTGIGKVNAAHAATCAVENFPVSTMINFGVGGAYPGSGLENGDVAVATAEIYGDEGVIDRNGWAGMEKIGIPVVQSGRKKYFNEFPLHAPAAAQQKKGELFKMKKGRFVTVSAATGTKKRAMELEKRFNAVCENMEGAAIAHVCAIYDIPVLEFRGISNCAGVRDRRKWDFDLASAHCQHVVLDVINRLAAKR